MAKFPKTKTETSLIQLSVTDKHQLRTLVHAYGNGDSDKWDGSFATEDPNKLKNAKYLSKARLNLRADQITAILEAMAVVEGRINAEKAEVSATAAQTAKDIAKDAAQCKAAGKCYCTAFSSRGCLGLSAIDSSPPYVQASLIS